MVFNMKKFLIHRSLNSILGRYRRARVFLPSHSFQHDAVFRSHVFELNFEIVYEWEPPPVQLLPKIISSATDLIETLIIFMPFGSAHFK